MFPCQLRSEFKELLKHGPFATFGANTLSDSDAGADSQATIKSVSKTPLIEDTLRDTQETVQRFIACKVHTEVVIPPVAISTKFGIVWRSGCCDAMGGRLGAAAGPHPFRV